MNTAQTTKNLAQKIATQMAQEPLEILKTARGQVAGEQTPQDPSQSGQSENKPELKYQQELQDKAKSGRRMEALDRELKDIERERIFKELQRRIAQGEEIPLEDYPGLSLEQKQVLKAQMEAVKTRSAKSGIQNAELQEPVAKKGRQLFNFGKKQEVKRQQTRVERIVPPSG